MRWRRRIQKYQKPLGTGLAALGMLMWAISAALRLGLGGQRDVSIGHFEARSLSVFADGPAPVIATALFAGFKSLYAIAFYILFCAVVSFAAAALLPD